MARDWVIAIIVAVVTVAGGWWVVRHTEWRQEAILLPLKGEARTNPFYAAGQLIERLGGHAVNQPSLEALPPKGSVLVLTSEYWSLFPQRRAALWHWIEEGGRLIVPQYLIEWDDQLYQWFPVTSKYAPTEESPSSQTVPQQCPSPEASYQERCPSFVARVWADDPSRAAQRFHSCTLDTSSTLRLGDEAPKGVRPIWSLDSEDGPWAMRLAVGRGSVTVLANEYPWTRRSFIEEDHPQIWLTLLQFQAGDIVWFVTDEDAPGLFSIIFNKGWPVVIFLVLALVAAMWRAMTRFGPLVQAPQAARRSLGEQIRGTASFLLRYRHTHVLLVAQARALSETAARTVPDWQTMSVPHRAQRLAQITGADVQSLTRALTWAQVPSSQDKPVPVSRADAAHAIILLETVRRRLAQPPHSNT